MNLRLLLPVATAVIAMTVAALPTLAAVDNTDALKNARDASAIFSDPAAALAAGYELLTDSADIACIDEAGTGGMGVHYVKGALVKAATIDAARPQALVYALDSSSKLQLVALEYVVIQADWDATHTSPPSLFGQDFNVTQAGNRFGLPSYYSLHAWIWKGNPSGTFNPWNPSVTCGGPLSASTNQYMCPMASFDVEDISLPSGDW